MKLSKNKRSILILGIVLILLVSSYWLPPIHSRLSWRIDDLITRIRYAVYPPDQIIFQPTPFTPALINSSATLPETNTTTATPSKLVTSSPTEIVSTNTPIPDSFSLPNVVYVDQKNRWNYCGPSNLTMALNYWGWPGDRDDVAAIVKPGIQDMSLDFIGRGKSDKNVMPYEMVDFVQDYTDFNTVLRYGGEIGLIKELVAAGYPVVVEKGYFERDYSGKISWMGHYQFVTGYDNQDQSIIVQDTYNDGPNFHIEDDEFTSGWRAFDYIFYLVYPPERESEVFKLLGQWADPGWSYQHALELSIQDIQSQTNMELFFAWFNKGTSLVKLTQYAEAALAYDTAFNLYARLGTDNLQRPYRMMWYQTGPYMAYYYSGRYGDAINLADVTLQTISPPTLEESYYWRGLSEFALGQTEAAIEDLRESVRLNIYFKPGIQMLTDLGVQP